MYRRTQKLRCGLLSAGESAKHPAYIAYLRQRGETIVPSVERRSQESARSIKQYLDAKYSR